MLVIPAMDLVEGAVVRLVQGDFGRKTVYSEDPVAVAQELEAAGAPMLHVVDLDGARLGAPQNVEVLLRIVRSVQIPVQFGGGVRSVHLARMVLALGVGRVVLGSALTRVESTVRHFFATLGDRCVAGVDAKEGMVAVHGWQDTTALGAVEFCARLEALGCPRVIFTDISRDGTLSGPNLAVLEEICRAVGVPVIASGGVSGPEDLRNLRRLAEVGLEGVIVGKALYEGDGALSDRYRRFTVHGSSAEHL
jgi:phosphoribosylformimino-5-aminoimidazole carboxamide ribotide isomerase